MVHVLKRWARAAVVALMFTAFCFAQRDSGVCYGQTPEGDQAREELDHAVRARIETSHPTFCARFGDGRTFDIQDEEIRLQGNVARISYLLVLFVSCEEGAPYEAIRLSETWVRNAKAWEWVAESTRGSSGEEEYWWAVYNRGSQSRFLSH